MTYQHILYEVRDHVATVTLNRPDRLNAWNNTMEQEVRRAMLAAGEDDDVRVIVVTGAGRAFCVGADLSPEFLARFFEMSDDERRAHMEWRPLPDAAEMHPDHQARFGYLLQVPKPIIAAINGSAVGIALAFVLFCDLRFIADNARISTAFAERGLIAEHGIAWALPRIAGVMNAQRMLYSARPFSAAEAAQMGLGQLVPAAELLPQVMALAADIVARSSPRSLRVMKQQVYDSLRQTLTESAEQGDEAMFLSFRSEDFREGVAHFMEKRAARFTGR